MLLTASSTDITHQLVAICYSAALNIYFTAVVDLSQYPNFLSRSFASQALPPRADTEKTWNRKGLACETSSI